ncbi:MAG: FlgD immunoglobulin-like domain containing protein [Candidatus Latescibacterota bacterium]
MNKFLSIIAALVLMVCALAPLAQAELPTADIKIEAVSDRDIAAHGLPEGSQKSSGLSVVGVGRTVYLTGGGSDPDKGAISSYAWSLTAKPTGSATAIAPNAEKATILPDLVGQYTVSLTVTDDQSETSVAAEQVITAGTWKGVANCALCHADKKAEWEETDHASMLERSIDGLTSSHYSGSCIGCHTVGYDTAATAVNGGFDDVAATLGWAFPETLEAGNWDAMPAALQGLSNIQCESCHGAGSQHMGDKTKIDISFDAGMCGQCHDSGTHHVFPYEWEQSAHATATTSPSGEGRESCVRCHTGIGFAQYADGEEATNLEYAPITCAGCHDPHSAENEHQLRKLDDVTLFNGEVISQGGLGKLCMNCHMSRRNAEEYVQVYSSRYGPHYGPQTDMLMGTNAAEFGKEIESSGHKYAASDACVTCHMAGTPGTDEPGQFMVGEHTFAMRWDGDTPEDDTDDVENVGACASCHGELESFDKKSSVDFDGDGSIEGVQTEVHGLLERLALKLPPLGDPAVTVTADYTASELMAAYNYKFVKDDGSYGVHNTKYAVGLLQLALKDLGDPVTSVEVDASVQGTPESYALGQNFPNPFNAETAISYSLTQEEPVVLEVCNTLGQRVRTLVQANQQPGAYVVRWDGRNDQGLSLGSGIYFYRLEAGTFSATKRMTLLQ